MSKTTAKKNLLEEAFIKAISEHKENKSLLENQFLSAALTNRGNTQSVIIDMAYLQNDAAVKDSGKVEVIYDSSKHLVYVRRFRPLKWIEVYYSQAGEIDAQNQPSTQDHLILRPGGNQYAYYVELATQLLAGQKPNDKQDNPEYRWFINNSVSINAGIYEKNPGAGHKWGSIIVIGALLLIGAILTGVAYNTVRDSWSWDDVQNWLEEVDSENSSYSENSGDYTEYQSQVNADALQKLREFPVVYFLDSDSGIEQTFSSIFEDAVTSSIELDNDPNHFYSLDTEYSYDYGSYFVDSLCYDRAVQNVSSVDGALQNGCYIFVDDQSGYTTYIDVRDSTLYSGETAFSAYIRTDEGKYIHLSYVGESDGATVAAENLTTIVRNIQVADEAELETIASEIYYVAD